MSPWRARQEQTAQVNDGVHNGHSAEPEVEAAWGTETLAVLAGAAMVVQ